MEACSCLELERFLLLAPCPPFGADDIFWQLTNQLADDKVKNRSILTYNETRIIARHCNVSERTTTEFVSPETTSAPSSTSLIIGIGCTLTLIALLMAMIGLRIYFNKRKVSEVCTNALKCSNLSSLGKDKNKSQLDGNGKQHNTNRVRPCTSVRALTLVKTTRHHSNHSYKPPSRTSMKTTN